MRRVLFAPAAAVLAILSGCSSPESEPGPTPVEAVALADAELSFARTAGEEGMRAGFLAFLARDAVIFRPGPVDGRAWFEPREEVPGRLLWAPAWVEATSDGALGYTSGPWEYRTAEGERAGTGYYISVWSREGGAGWRVALDIGISCPLPETLDPTAAAWKPVRASRTGFAGAADPTRGFSAVDRELAVTEGAKGTARFLEHASNHVLVFRPGSLPAEGPLAAERLLAAERAGTTRRREDVRLAPSGELGYAYGAIVAASGEVAGGYLRVWRREADGVWRVAVDVVSGEAE